MSFRKKILSLTLVSSLLISVASCSEKLPDETTPTTTESTTVATTLPPETEAVPETTAETEPTESQPRHGPFSTAQVERRVVDEYGQLYVEGTQLMSSITNEPVQLRGMSSYGLYMCTGFFNEDTIQTLVQDWGCSVIRIAMYTVGTADGYIERPDRYFEQVCDITDICIEQGVYVICDWHILADGDPNQYKAEALDFFERYSAIYADSPNVLYEICNEPNGECFDDPTQTVSWENCIKPYAEDVIDVIRGNDPDNVIIVGTSTWSHDVHIASESPIEGEDNLMYTFHFYAGSSGQETRDIVQQALDNGLPVFCTEWGTTYDSGNGGPCLEESDEWIAFMNERNISWCNWSIGGAAAETSNALIYMSNILEPIEKIQGHWPDEFISASGLYVREQILAGAFAELEASSSETPVGEEEPA